MSLQSSKVQNLFTDQISSTCLNLRLRYNYFRFRKTNVRHIEIFLSVFLLGPYRSNRRAIPHHAAMFRPNRATRCGVITSYKISRWRQRWLNTTSDFICSDVGASWLFWLLRLINTLTYLLLSEGWIIYLQTKFRQDICET